MPGHRRRRVGDRNPPAAPIQRLAMAPAVPSQPGHPTRLLGMLQLRVRRRPIPLPLAILPKHLHPTPFSLATALPAIFTLPSLQSLHLPISGLRRISRTPILGSISSISSRKPCHIVTPMASICCITGSSPRTSNKPLPLEVQRKTEGRESLDLALIELGDRKQNCITSLANDELISPVVKAVQSKASENRSVKNKTREAQSRAR